MNVNSCDRSTYKRIIPALLGLSLLAACAGIEHEPLVSIESSVSKRPLSPIAEQAKRLREIAKGRENAEQSIQDILAAMDAVQSEENGAWEAAAQNWLLVIELDSGSMASMALPRWVKAQQQLLVDMPPADLLARLLLAQTRDGQDSLWLRKQGLSDLSKLTQKVKEIQAESPKGPAALPASPKDIKDDPLWEKAAKLSCRNDLPDAWRNWIRAMSPDQRSYWEGLQASCRQDYRAALGKFQSALPGLRLNLSTWPLAINAAEKIVSGRKNLGQREETALAYRQLADLLVQSETQSAALGWSPFELGRKRVDSWYWVARTQALQGDYQSAKIAVHEGFDQLNLAQTQVADLTEKQRQTYNDLRAEGYNILASRIAFEEKDFAAALSLTRLGQDVPGISPEWRQRLDWSEGWFAFVMNDKARAARVWKVMLSGIKDDLQRPRIYYWLGRSLIESGQKSEGQSYFEKLQTEHPLSFYTVVGLPRLDPSVVPQKAFGSTGRLENRLKDRASFPWDAYRNDKEAERRLLRLELMVAAGVTSWIEPMASELFRTVSSKPALLKDVEASLYVSRLLHMAGSHLQAISLTTQLSNQVQGFWEAYPEQLLIFFPRPYLDVYQRLATQNYIDLEIPLAISRQESSFQADAVSPAEAMGLMQLMSNTAQKQATRLGLSLNDVETDLRKPEINISLGTAYLAELGRRYRGQWHQAFAAYNAGEYVVDAWLQRRGAEDPMVWIEGLSFAETSGYAKNVWRNWEVYRWLLKQR